MPNAILRQQRTSGGAAILGTQYAAAGAAANAPGAALVGTSSFSGGGASAAAAAGGFALTGTSSFAGGGAGASANAPGAALVSASNDFTGGVASSQSGIAAVTIPSSRTAMFIGGSRVIPFGAESSALAVGPNPYYKNKQWWVDKVAADKLFYVGDISRDLTESGTTATAVSAAATVGATVLVAPVLQGSLIVIKVGQLDTSANANNYVTLRITCADGEQFDRTIHFNPISDGAWTFVKDPDDQRYYAFNVASDLGYSSSTLQTLQAPTAVGVTSLATPAIQGNLAIVKIGGLDVSNNPTNSCLLPMTFASGEQIFRTIYFTRQDN